MQKTDWRILRYAGQWGVRVLADDPKGPLRHALPGWTSGPLAGGVHRATARVTFPHARDWPLTWSACERRWALIHEISHALCSDPPDDVCELTSEMLALDYFAGRHMRMRGWNIWMAEFSAGMGMWLDQSRAKRKAWIDASLQKAVQRGLLRPDGTPTFQPDESLQTRITKGRSVE